MRFQLPWAALCAVVFWGLPDVDAADVFRVATFNVENYASASSRPTKSAQSKAKVVESIAACHPDVIAIEEIGSSNDLLELQSSLASAGLKLPFWELVDGADTNIHVAILSRFEFAARRPHTNESYVLGTRHLRMSRGVAEVDVQLASNDVVTIIAAHLKSRLPMLAADETEMRDKEAQILRRLIDARLAAAPGAGLIVLGDFNDRQDSAAVKSVIGRGKAALFDTRPSEHNPLAPSPEPVERKGRTINWTYYYSKEDVYSRVDYILLNAETKRRWVASESFIPSVLGWGVASDHRPVVCAFSMADAR